MDNLAVRKCWKSDQLRISWISTVQKGRSSLKYQLTWFLNVPDLKGHNKVTSVDPSPVVHLRSVPVRGFWGSTTFPVLCCSCPTYIFTTIIFKGGNILFLWTISLQFMSERNNTFCFHLKLWTQNLSDPGTHPRFLRFLMRHLRHMFYFTWFVWTESESRHILLMFASITNVRVLEAVGWTGWVTGRTCMRRSFNLFKGRK